MDRPISADFGHARPRRRLAHALVVPALAVVGCTQVRPEADFAQARQLIAESTGVEAVYDPEEPFRVEHGLDAVLADGLSLDEALRLVLLNNRQLQAEFMSIGIARADWVQAGLLSNPTLGFSAQLPEGGGRSNIQASIAQNIVDLWQIPRRRQVAQTSLDETILRIAHRAAALAAETEAAYFRAKAAEERLALARKNLELVGKSHQAVTAQYQAGIATGLDENLARGQALSAELGVRKARLAAATAKRRLARLLSIARNVDDVLLLDELPETFEQPPAAERIIELARGNRLDLRALRHSVQARLADVAVERLKVFPDVSLGLAFERLERRAQSGRDVPADFVRASLSNGAFSAPAIQSQHERRAAESEVIDTILGPSLNLTLPIFDQNQAQIAKAEYLYEQELRAYEGAYLRIAQDIRIATDVARTAFQNAAYYHDHLVPQAEKNLEFATASYSSGQTNILTLIEAQRLSLEARRGYIDVRLEASTAVADLEKVVGMQVERMIAPADPGAIPELSSNGNRAKGP